MAAGTKINLVFNNSEGKTTSYTWNYAKAGATLANVQALATAMITNTAILASTLTSLKSAKTVTTSENVIYNENASTETIIGNSEINDELEPGTETRTIEYSKEEIEKAKKVLGM